MGLIIVSIFVIVFIIFYILIFVKKTYKYKYDPFYDYDNIKNNIKTGDIILFSCKNNRNLYNSIEYLLRTEFIGSEYGHVGIILKDESNNLFVIECVANDHCADKHATYLNNYKKGGIRIIELEKILNEYCKENAALFAIKFISREIPYSIAINNLNKYKDITFENKGRLFILGIIDVIISNNIGKKLALKINNNKMCCSEFAHNFLYNCNVLKKYPSKIFWPHLITNDLFDEIEIVKYSKPYKFKLKNKK